MPAAAGAPPPLRRRRSLRAALARRAAPSSSAAAGAPAAPVQIRVRKVGKRRDESIGSGVGQQAFNFEEVVLFPTRGCIKGEDLGCCKPVHMQRAPWACRRRAACLPPVRRPRAGAAAPAPSPRASATRRTALTSCAAAPPGETISAQDEEEEGPEASQSVRIE